MYLTHYNAVIVIDMALFLVEHLRIVCVCCQYMAGIERHQYSGSEWVNH